VINITKRKVAKGIIPFRHLSLGKKASLTTEICLNLKEKTIYRLRIFACPICGKIARTHTGENE
jgi:predicted RNA-binding Zn-ribbon protein involved in translation (DUF1610 family)